jgi:hypothetical protein
MMNQAWFNMSIALHIQHVNNFCHIRRLRQIRRYFGEDAAVQLRLTLVTSRLDYCNSVLAGLTACAECAECSCQARLQPAASMPRHTSPTSTALAAGIHADYILSCASLCFKRILAFCRLTCHRRSAAARPLCDDLGCVPKVHVITFRQGYAQYLAREHFRMSDPTHGTTFLHL